MHRLAGSEMRVGRGNGAEVPGGKIVGGNKILHKATVGSESNLDEKKEQNRVKK